MRRNAFSLLLATALGVVLFASGCATRSTSLVWHIPATPGQKTDSGLPVIAEMHAQNIGFFLFNVIPIFSGDDTEPNGQKYVSFRNRIRPWYNARMMDFRARRIGAVDLASIHHERKDTGAFSLWLIWRRQMDSSALAVGPVKK